MVQWDFSGQMLRQDSATPVDCKEADPIVLDVYIYCESVIEMASYLITYLAISAQNGHLAGGTVVAVSARDVV